MHVFIDRSSIEINTPVFSLGKCVRTVAKAMFVDRKKKQQQQNSFTTFGVGTPAKCCKIRDVPTLDGSRTPQR